VRGSHAGTRSLGAIARFTAAVRVARHRDSGTRRARTSSLRAREALRALVLFVAMAVTAALTATGASAQGTGDGPAWDASAAVDARVEALVGQMTVEEKVDLATGQLNNFFGFYNNPIDRLGIPELKMADGPNGVRLNNPNVNEGKGTALPSALALAATWDPQMASQYGDVMGLESHLTNHNVVLGPAMDIARTALGGRTFEALGEDPLLGAKIAVPEILAIQQHPVSADAKHYLDNNQEYHRFSVDARVDERTQHEIYLPAFEAAVKQGHVGTVMCAFNQVNTVFSCGNRSLLTDVLRQELGFRGLTLSDYRATPSTAGAANAGLTQEHPGGLVWGPQLLAAVRAGEVSMARLDEMTRETLRPMIGLGMFDDPAVIAPLPVERDGRVAREIGRDAIVLLKNSNQALPLQRGRSLRSIAVIGPDADNTSAAGGGSGLVKPTYSVSPLQGIQDRAGSGVRVDYSPGTEPISAGAMLPGPPPVPREVLSPAGGSPGQQGLHAEYWTNASFQGSPQLVRTDRTVDVNLGFFNFPGFNAQSPKLPATPGDFNNDFSGRWTGTFTAPGTGQYTLALTSRGTSRLWLDGRLLIEQNDPNGTTTPVPHPAATKTVSINLLAGQRHDIRIEYAAVGGARNAEKAMVKFGWRFPNGTLPPAMKDAVRLASRANAAVVVVRNYTSEGNADLPSLDLPNDQDTLIREVAAANPRTIVVLETGGAIKTSTWDSRTPAVLSAWFNGQEQGHAIADVLFGDTNPSGKLPLTFPETEAETPINTPEQYPGVGDVARYSEGVFVGYRGYDKLRIRPRFPFGYALSYTSFRYANLQTQTLPDGGVQIRFRLRNTGARTGAEVPQVYVGPLPTSVATPLKRLAGFDKVQLDPGESRRVTITLDPRAFSYWGSYSHRWITPGGEVPIYVGSSSRDVQLTGSTTVAAGAADDPTISTADWFAVINQRTERCLDAKDWGTANGTAVQQWVCPAPQPNAEWKFVPATDGYFQIANRNASDKVLDVAGGTGATGDGAKVRLWTSTGAANQQWKPEPVGNGYYRLIARHSNKCLEVPGAPEQNGVVLEQRTCNGSAAQAFRLWKQ
jgi:beta-glucosidase